VVALAALLATLAPRSSADAHGIGHLVDEPRELRLPEVRRATRLHEEVHRLFARYQRLERRTGRAWMRAVEADRALEVARERVEGARERLDLRVRAAYQLGPGASIQALLGATSFADLAAIGVYTERMIELDETVLRDGIVAEATLAARRALTEAERARLAPRLEELRELMRVIRRKQGRAIALAEQASIEDEALREEQRAIELAAARQGTWDIIGYEEDQSGLLALLGPTGGRTCETPPGLLETGQAFEGYASWYGWEFGGQPTATGAIFDPRLFTAANRWLPFGTFLRVRYGDRCALVLVNDRGPYGRLERVIDLSEAAAKYLGVGVSWVRAEILVPEASIG
jgi:hypothetical protein